MSETTAPVVGSEPVVTQVDGVDVLRAQPIYENRPPAPRPSEGRTVHFVLPNGEHRPAVITKAWNEQGMVNLVVFKGQKTDHVGVQGLVCGGDPNSPTFLVGSIWPGQGPGTWHWPERV